MSTVTWPERFTHSFTVEQIDREDYLTGAPGADGAFYCKACGSLQTGSRSKHFEQHSHELKKFAETRAAELKQARVNALHPNGTKKVKQEKGEFYEKPCTSCGAQIARTGKRGAPPKQCETCKGKTAAPTVKVTCKHEKTDGSKCGSKPLKGSEFCRWHQQ